jgi:ComF family protein
MWYNRLLDVFYPETCLGCGKTGMPLCEKCLAGLPEPHQSPSPWMHSLYSYKHPLVRNSIWKLKYSNAHGIARIYGKHLYDMLLADIGEKILFDQSPVYLIPIPMSKKRLRERGYNQAVLLAQAVLACDTEQLLCDGSKYLKKHDTENRQSHTKNKSARLHNIIDSFYVPTELPEGARFVLIDDVITTGATVREAKKALILHGARKISAYGIAH